MSVTHGQYFNAAQPRAARPFARFVYGGPNSVPELGTQGVHTIRD